MLRFRMSRRLHRLTEIRDRFLGPRNLMLEGLAETPEMSLEVPPQGAIHALSRLETPS